MEGKSLIVSKKDVKRRKLKTYLPAAFWIPLLTDNKGRRATWGSAEDSSVISSSNMDKDRLAILSLRIPSHKFTRGCLRLKEAAELNSDGRK